MAGGSGVHVEGDVESTWRMAWSPHKEELKETVENAKELLSQWFSEVKSWMPTMVAKERLVWLKCFGVPLHVWGSEFFSSIASEWGKFISLYDNTRLKKRFDVARVLISIAEDKIISKAINYMINGHMYCIHCMEEELSSGCFSLKSDFVPKYQYALDEVEDGSWDSDEEDDEDVANNGWRIDDEIEGLFKLCGSKKKDFANQPIYGELGATSRRKEKNEEEESSDARGNCELVPKIINCGNIESSVQQLDIQKYSNFENGSLQLDRSRTKVTEQPENGGDEEAQFLTKQGHYKQNESDPPKETIEEHEEVNSFWKGLASDLGRLQEWMKVGERKNLRKRNSKRQKVRACMAVYQYSTMVANKDSLTKKRGRSNLKKNQRERIPTFILDLLNPVVGGSIFYSGIFNCNRGGIQSNQGSMANEIWKFAKIMGISTRGSDKETVKRIAELERRDKEARKLLMQKGATNGKNVSNLVP
ncbi:hypothetical protein SLEP1_g35265 [Rubroshorea leprosula]|uniref:DUF4283 domain-containing protein n=1 Tax=Rubroshorea leprosula TaxID=152421 RepID=A0AAV5KMR0_9ROSI|nr:hypothetical protein SLEP1_g35265 [Rubroshorea leprosula]